MACVQEKFDNLQKEFQALSSDHNQLKLATERLKKYCMYLEEENLSLKKLMNSYKISNGQTLATSPALNPQQNLKVSKPILAKPPRIITNYPRELNTKSSPTCGKTPQPSPDVGIDIEPANTLYEAFFILGAKPLTPSSILFEYPLENSISQAMKNTMLSLALPQTVKLRRAGTASEINELVFGQIPPKRSTNCFSFTMRSERTDLTADLLFPNADHEVVYFTCVLVEDIVESEGVEYVTTKSYCIASYVPAFELHYETLCSILFMKRLHRMDILRGMENGEITPKLSNIEITPQGIELLQELGKINYFQDTTEICVKTSSMDCFKYKVPQDLQFLDIPWLCTPLFSYLAVQDLAWLIAALVQEKSIVFISENLALLTSCVLGLRALIRPLHWMNLTVPLIPENLIDLLEAPVPILAGITHLDANTRFDYSNIIWVILEEEDPHQKIQVSTNFDIEVVELSSDIVSQVEKIYKFVPENAFERSLEVEKVAIKVANVFYGYWRSILGKFNERSLKKESFVKKMIGRMQAEEQKFVGALIGTQLFANSLESNRHV